MRRLALAAFAVAILLMPALGVLPSGLPGAATDIAAATGLTTTADARYVVDPAAHRVHVSVALSATNHLSDTKTHRYFFDRAYLAVPPGTSGFKVSSAGAHPAVSVIARKSTYAMLRIAFGAHLAAGATRAFKLTFDIPDPGGAATRTTRIGLSLVRFAAWGLASDGATGGSVTVVFPSGFNVDVGGAALKPTTDASGNVVYATGRLANPATFLATFSADRPSALKSSTLEIPVGADTIPVTIKSWPDDSAWAKRVRDTLSKGLPILAREIGLPWTAARPLVVQEAVSRTATSVAGTFDPTTGTMELAYYVDPIVILHETAHAWFDGGLLTDRWANEGFASFYALRAARQIGVRTPTGAPLTPALRKVVVPLNAWAPATDASATGAGDPGATTGGTAVTSSATTDAAESAAALTLATDAGKRAGIAGLRSLWQEIASGQAAYQPAGAGADVERADTTPDWRALLDLLEERTGTGFTDLWSTWVVRPTEAGLLADRTSMRDRYAAMIDRVGTWRLPRVVRDSLRVWRYDETAELLDAASHALDARDAVATAAASAGLTPPSTMETDFEGSRGFAAASAEADAELAVIDAYRAAGAARPTQPGPLATVGLLWSSADASLTDAAAAFSAGDLQGAMRDSIFARQTWDGADTIGRNRILAVVASLGAILLGGWLALRWYRDRGVRRRTLLYRR
jgi:hypothetical protein